MSRETSLKVFKHTILPKFDYCAFLYDSAAKSWTEKIERNQNRAMKCCLRLYNYHISSKELQFRCEVPSQTKRRLELTASLFFKRAKKLPQIPNPRTRSQTRPLFPLRRPRLTLYSKSPMYRGMQLWNSLPEHLQKIEIKSTFKTALKRFLGTNMKGMRRALLMGALNPD